MASDTVPGNYRTPLSHLQQMMQGHYALFQSGIISEKEYLTVIKPLDQAIDTVEMSTLKGYLASKEASLKHFPAPEK
jgi:hypothetical protein